MSKLFPFRRFEDLIRYLWLIAALSGTPVYQTSWATDPIEGSSMGMSYRLVFGQEISSELRTECQTWMVSELSRIESIFSLYQSDSELARWNHNAAMEWIEVSHDLFALVEHAFELWRITDGAFDPTIRPLIAAWRWEKLDLDWKPPTAESLAIAKSRTGLANIELDSTRRSMRKRTNGVELDLNSLVEGWALDSISTHLRAKGIANFLVQLGGEFYGVGKNSSGEPWTIAIEDPANSFRIVATVDLVDQAMSVSGNYRSGRRYGEKWYSHILDPRTGFPSRDRACSVAVIAHQAVDADGWATALMAVERSLASKLANERSAAVCFFDSSRSETICEVTAKGGETVHLSKPNLVVASVSEKIRRVLLAGLFSSLIAVFTWRTIRLCISIQRKADTIESR